MAISCRDFAAWAAELGHIIIDPNGPLCGCGHQGHLEAFPSGPAIARYVANRSRRDKNHRFPPTQSPQPFKWPKLPVTGDALAISAFERAGYYLGIAVANYLATFDPSILIFGGGASQAGDLLFLPFQKSLKEHVFHPHYLDDLIITKAALGDDAGLLGALALARLALEQDERQTSR